MVLYDFVSPWRDFAFAKWDVNLRMLAKICWSCCVSSRYRLHALRYRNCAIFLGHLP
jgi:hypothetical protein